MLYFEKKYLRPPKKVFPRFLACPQKIKFPNILLVPELPNVFACSGDGSKEIVEKLFFLGTILP